MSHLSEAELQRLFVRWQQDHDSAARERLLEQYLPLAYKLARRYYHGGEPLDDLRQVAALGLLKAIDGFDSARENGFSAYAVPSILGELRRYFRAVGWAVHVPRGLQEIALRVEPARRALEIDHPTVTAAMIADHLGVSVEEVLEALAARDSQYAVPLEAPGDEEEGAAPPLSLQIGFRDAGYENAELSVDLQRAGADLSDRERNVLRLRFEADMTQSEIGAELGISQMHVSRLLRQALERLSNAGDLDGIAD